MTEPMVTSLDLRIIDRVLEMGGGYVLDFSDLSFARFFQDFRVGIDDPRYSAEGTSKAKRLRYFLSVTPPPLSGRVLAGLLQHRLTSKPDGLDESDLRRYEEIVVRLGGAVPLREKPAPKESTSEADLLLKVFDEGVFAKLPLETSLSRALVERMEEAHRCIEAKANLSAVILCGSVLEGMCLGFGIRFPERANRAFTAQFNRPPPQFPDWKLREWIDALGRIDALSPNVTKFGHALRDFRNYVHPAEQLANRFCPDVRTARIGFQVVVAAAEDLLKATIRMGGP